MCGIIRMRDVTMDHVNLRMQLDLRQIIDDMIREGWEVVSRSPDLVVERRKVRKEVRAVGNRQVVITL